VSAAAGDAPGPDAGDAVSAPGPTGVRLSRSVVLAVLASFGAGLCVSGQTAINGHVSAIVGSPILSTAVNHGTALVLSVLVALATGAFPRAWRTLRARRGQLRLWWFLGGIFGFAGLFTIILVTPLAGLVAVTVALTLGQLGGSLIADLAALGPGGRKPLTPWRLVGLGVAVLAVFTGAWGRLEEHQPLLLAAVVLAGVIIALQQAGNGQLTVATGEFAAMSTINFLVGGVCVFATLLIVNAFVPQDFAAIPPWAPLGGLLGAITGVTVAICVRFVGVLSVMLALVAGQAVGAVVLDLLIPADRAEIGVASILGAALAVVAVGIAGWSGRRSRGGAASAGGRPQPGSRVP